MSRPAPRQVRAPRRRRQAPVLPAVRSAATGVATAVTAASLLLLVPAAPAGADPIRDQQWALGRLHAQQAWHSSKGAGITVAVLDTGVDPTHPDLTGQVLPGKDLIGFGARRGDGSWARHGTAMASIIAGHGHGSGDSEGVLGLAPKAKILPVRVILEGSDPARDRARTSRGDALALGIRWAVDHGADVINLSLGDDSASAHPEREEDEAVQYALAKGVPVVASAGNGGQKGDHISYPAAYPGVIAVAAVDKYGAPADFSTRGWYADVSAPGVDVVIADPDRHYYEGWGTSAAAAFVSATVALVRSAHPHLTPAGIKTLLEDTARDAPKDGRDDAIGYGLVDPAAALAGAARLSHAGARGTVAGYTRSYFGPGPTKPPEPPGPTAWPAPVAGGTGGLLLVAAGALWVNGRRQRQRAEAAAPGGD